MKFRAKGFEFSNPRHVTLTEVDLLNAVDTAIEVSKWNLIGKKQITAGIAYEMGYGQDEGQHSALARAYAIFKDTAATVLSGKIKFVILDEEQNQESSGAMDELGTDVLNSSATDRTKQLPFSATGKLATQDKYIAIFYYGTIGNGTLDVSACDLAFSATKWKADRV